MKTIKQDNKKIRKTIAFDENTLSIINQKANDLGLSTVDFIRFLVLKEAEKERDTLTENGLFLKEEKLILKRANEIKKGKNTKNFNSTKEMISYLNK